MSIQEQLVQIGIYMHILIIDTPLTTSDNKHSLPDSLIFIDENAQIKTLSREPTLIYSGTANEGTTKTTEIT